MMTDVLALQRIVDDKNLIFDVELRTYEPQEDDTASEVQADEREITCTGTVIFFLRKWLRLLKSELKKSKKAFVS